LLTWFAKLPGTTSEEERLQAGIAGAKGRRAATARLLNSRMEK